MPELKRWSKTDLPFFLDEPKVHVCMGGQFGLITRMFAEVGFKRADTPEEADLVVFGGGSDVSTSYYGQKPIAECGHPDPRRDAYEAGVYNQCRANNIAMMGICRGAQFLHVMNGGSLWQHVDNHTRSHLMLDVLSNQEVMTSSTHHQMMRFNNDMDLIACVRGQQATIFKDENETKDMNKLQSVDRPVEVEVCSYKDTRSLCMQGHPEYGPSEFTSWALTLLLSWLPANSDTYNPRELALN